MNRGCLALSGLGLISLFVFGVTLEAINDPKDLSAIPFSPWDFLTYGLTAAAIPMLILVARNRDPRKTLPGKWTSHVTHNGARFRATLRLDSDGNAEIYTKGKAIDSERELRTNARWQLLDGTRLHLLGTRSVIWRILKLNSRRMVTTVSSDSTYLVSWTKNPRINTEACLLIAAAVLLPILVALSLPHSGPAHAIAEDPQYVPFDISHQR